MKTGIELIAEEQLRSREEKGYTPSHDKEHSAGELAMAAMCYAMLPVWRPADMAPMGWPWVSCDPQDGFKPTPNNRIRELVKAGQLIASEIDRLLNEDVV